MFCTKCGNEVPENSSFCPNCGTAVKPEQKDTLGPEVFDPPQRQQTYTQPPTQPQQANNQNNQNEGIYGLLGFILSFFVPIVGLILSIMGLSRQKNKSLAVAGLVISILSMVFTFIIIIVAISTASSYPTDYPYYYYLASLI